MIIDPAKYYVVEDYVDEVCSEHTTEAEARAEFDRIPRDVQQMFTVYRGDNLLNWLAKDHRDRYPHLYPDHR